MTKSRGSPGAEETPIGLDRPPTTGFRLIDAGPSWVGSTETWGVGVMSAGAEAVAAGAEAEAVVVVVAVAGGAIEVTPFGEGDCVD
jgi:hypothetical protein